MSILGRISTQDHPSLADFEHVLSAVRRASYQALLPLTTRTTSSITGTSISTPTTVASAPRRVQAEQADGGGHRQLKEVGRANQRRGAGHAVLRPARG